MLKIKNRKVWWTSDPHYWHKNITYGVSDWPNKEANCRRFETVKEMSLEIVNQINKNVGEDDVLICAGDWSFGGRNNIWNFRRQIKCKEIHLVYGNHDTQIKKNSSLEVFDNGIVTGNIRAQKLFTSVQDYLEVVIDDNLFCVLHYPMEECNDRFKNSYHLFGHVHGRIPHSNKRTDIGVDYAYKIFGEYRPFETSELLQLFKEKENELGINI